jgi:hypothetical protein
MNHDAIDFLRRRQIIAEELRSFYRIKKTERLGENYKPSARQDTMNSWEKVAEICMQLNANAEDFINAAFEQSAFPEGPYLTHLIGHTGRKWYAGYMNVRPSTVKTDHHNKEDDSIPEIGGADKSTFKADIELTAKKINRICGEPVRGGVFTDRQMDVLRDKFIPIPFYIRVLLGYPCEIIMRQWGDEAIDFFHKRPNFRMLAKAHDYPIDEILQWTKKQLERS